MHKQRIIKYRGMSVDNEMIYGTGCYVDKSGNEFIINESVSDNLFVIVRKGTLSQYTNLDDKNGKEIYKGDIVKEDYKDKFGEDIIYEIWDLPELFHRFGEGVFSPKDVEIIGNKWENPELIK